MNEDTSAALRAAAERGELRLLVEDHGQPVRKALAELRASLGEPRARGGARDRPRPQPAIQFGPWRDRLIGEYGSEAAAAAYLAQYAVECAKDDAEFRREVAAARRGVTPPAPATVKTDAPTITATETEPAANASVPEAPPLLAKPIVKRGDFEHELRKAGDWDTFDSDMKRWSRTDPRGLAEARAGLKHGHFYREKLIEYGNRLSSVHKGGAFYRERFFGVEFGKA